MQVEAEAQAASYSDSLHFLTNASLPTVGKLLCDRQSDALHTASVCTWLLSSDFTVHEPR